MEQEIQQRLARGESITHLTSDLESRWFTRETTPDDRRSIGCFLMNSRQYGRLFYMLARTFNEQILVPWDLVVEALGSRPTISDEVLKWVEEGFIKDGAGAEAALSFALDKASTYLRNYRKAIEVERAKQFKTVKGKLLDKLEYARTQRLVEEEGKLLHDIARLDPSDRDVQQWLDTHKWRWAREVISRQSPVRPEVAGPKLEFLTEDQKRDVKSLRRVCHQLLNEDPELGMDLAVMLYLFDDFGGCVEVLTQVEPYPARNWLLLHVLTLTERPLEALEVIFRVFPAADNDPEIKLSLLYFKAQAFFALGQTHEAIDVARQILEVHPHYRNMEQLIAIWEGKV